MMVIQKKKCVSLVAKVGYPFKIYSQLGTLYGKIFFAVFLRFLRSQIAGSRKKLLIYERN